MKKINTKKLFNKERWLKKDEKHSWKELLFYTIVSFSLSILFPLVYLSDSPSSVLDITISQFVGNVFFFLGIVLLFLTVIQKITEEIANEQ